MQNQESYPSDLTDTEWELIGALFPGPQKLGRPARYEKRAILNAIFYVVRSGCSWRMLPRDLPPWRIVYYYFMRWRQEGLWEALHEGLRDGARMTAAKKKRRPLRSSTRKVLKHLTTPESAAMMQAKRCWDENDIWW